MDSKILIGVTVVANVTGVIYIHFIVANASDGQCNIFYLE